MQHGGKKYQVLAKNPGWDVFRLQYDLKEPLPIQVLKPPVVDHRGILRQRGVMIVGNEVLDDLFGRHGLNLKKYWFIICTTLSHLVQDAPLADLNMFSNSEGTEEYLNSGSANVPYFNVTCGLFIDTSFFVPNPTEPKIYDLIYVAKWHPSKRIELFLRANAVLQNEVKSLLVSVPVPTKSMSGVSDNYKKFILKELEKSQNTILIESPSGVYEHPDNTYVPGGFMPEQMRRFYNQSKIVVLLSDWGEGVNRSICEGISCNLPAIVTNDLVGGSKQVINDQVGAFVNPEPQGITEGIVKVLNNYQNFHPKNWFVDNYGTQNSMNMLKGKIKSILNNSGEFIDLSVLKNYTGGPWTKDYYEIVERINYHAQIKNFANILKYDSFPLYRSDIKTRCPPRYSSRNDCRRLRTSWF